MNAGQLLRELRRKKHWPQYRFAMESEINRTVLSEIENGERPLTPRYLDRIEQKNIFRPSQIRMLRHCAAQDKLQIDFQYDLAEQRQPVLEAFEATLAEIRQQRQHDGTIHIGRLIPYYVKALKELREQYPADKLRIDGLIGKAIVERLDTARQTTLSHKISSESKRELTLLSELLNSLANYPEIHDNAYILPAAVKYVAAETAQEMLLLGKLAKQVSTSYAKTLCLRGGIVAPAVLNRQNRLIQSEARNLFHQAEDYALKVVAEDQLTLGECASVYEALSYGYCLFGELVQANSFFTMAKNVHTQADLNGTKLAAIDILLLRTEFSNLAVSPELDLQAIMDVSEKGLNMFEKSGFKRHLKQIINDLHAHANPQLQEFGKHLRYSY